MRGIDDPMVLERGERTSRARLRTECRLTLRRSVLWPRSSIEDAHDLVGRRSAWTRLPSTTRKAVPKAGLLAAIDEAIQSGEHGQREV
jgi:hypothetical protein